MNLLHFFQNDPRPSRVMYGLSLTFLSLVIAVIAAIATLWLMLQCDRGTRIRQRIFKTISALLMGVAICGVHYTAMAAAIFVPVEQREVAESFFNFPPEQLAFFVACIASLILFGGLYVIGRQPSIFFKLIFGYLIILLMMVPLIYTALFSMQSPNLAPLQKTSLHLTITVIVTVAVLALILSLFISLRISRPIAQLRDIFHEIAKGGLNKRAPVESEDEIGQLAGSFNAMVDALEASNKKKDEFMGMAAHDLRIPVSVIQEGSNLLSMQALGSLNQKQLRLADMITRASSSMAILLDDLLTVDTVHAKSIQINRKTVNLIDFTDSIFVFNQMLAEKKYIKLNMDNLIQEKVAFFDENKISQVINNFISNAIKFSPTYARIDLIVKKIGEYLRLEVQDEAGGIPEEEHTKVFTWFAKISVKPTHGEASHGLGLAICKDIIEAHGGHIGFKSTFGKGSTFFFEIKAFQKA
jgi:signal transduction histidine kinase